MRIIIQVNNPRKESIMKKLGTAFVLGTALFSAPALAADLPAAVYKAAPAVVAAYNWSGFYVGVNAGWLTTRDNDVTFSGTDTGAGGLGTALALGGIPRSLGVSSDGFIGGGQIGYNWQVSQWVFGLEADLQWADAGGSSTVNITAPGLVPIATTASSDLNWLGTVRGRLGIAWDRVLVYATGGLAYGETEVGIRVVAPAAGPPLNAASTNTNTRSGWTLGGGAEFALWSNWTAKAEYLYFDLGSSSTSVAYAYGANNSTLTGTADNKGHIFRVGLNYRFGPTFR
jgi:outer membrane immunogenic protein